MSLRPIKRLIKSKPTIEGAGVHLRRAFGFGNTSDFDPFLLLDDFRNDNPKDYLAGFPSKQLPMSWQERSSTATASATVEASTPARSSG